MFQSKQGLFYRTQQLEAAEVGWTCRYFFLTSFGLSMSRSFLVDTSATRASGEILNYRLWRLKLLDLAESCRMILDSSESVSSWAERSEGVR